MRNGNQQLSFFSNKIMPQRTEYFANKINVLYVTLIEANFSSLINI